MASHRLQTRRGGTTAADPQAAVEELYAAIYQPDMQAVIFFCSSTYDLAALGAALKARFACPLVGCTSSGEIGSGLGYKAGGIVGVSLASDELRVHPHLIRPLAGFQVTDATALAQALRGELRIARELGPEHTFGLLLVDGLSMLEEQVVASLYNQLGGTSIIGGSAGDDLKFEKTFVYHDGAFHPKAAVFTLFETTLPFRTFKIQHFEPSETRLVITEADGPTRTVFEINGGPAAEEYARAVGLEVAELSPQVFAAHPVMLRVGGEYFVRSIQKVNPDGSLTFYCAIDNGLVLTVARGHHLVENLKQNLAALAAELPDLGLILGCDCILRRLELQQKSIIAEAEQALAGYNFIGFSTYGEQWNGIHVNQTLTGVAIGG